jgi:hypothetical protein
MNCSITGILTRGRLSELINRTQKLSQGPASFAKDVASQIRYFDVRVLKFVGTQIRGGAAFRDQRLSVLESNHDISGLVVYTVDQLGRSENGSAGHETILFN